MQLNKKLMNKWISKQINKVMYENVNKYKNISKVINI